MWKSVGFLILGFLAGSVFVSVYDDGSALDDLSVEEGIDRGETVDISSVALDPDSHRGDLTVVRGSLYGTSGGVVDHHYDGFEDYVVVDSDGYKLHVSCDRGPSSPDGSTFTVEGDVFVDEMLGDSYVGLDCVSPINS